MKGDRIVEIRFLTLNIEALWNRMDGGRKAQNSW